jgi:Gram-negative bacterial TonB protein C-terminal/BlaR1 peptidase M56
MNHYLNYLVEANISLVFFLAAYLLVLRKETTFGFQRMFLLTGIVGSLIFPLVHISFPETRIPSLSQVIPSYLLPEVTIQAEGSRSLLDYWYFIELVYIGGILFFLARFILQLIQLIRKLRYSTPHKVGIYRIIESPEHQHTFSFFNYIFLGQSEILNAEEKNRIIQHETVHARQLHSCDLLLINVVGIFFWFNPLLRIYKKIFIQLHEFEADARAVENRDGNAYCILLAKVALQSADFPLANHFNNSLTLKRITMINTLKQKIKTWKMVAVASALPLVFVIIACQEQVTTEVRNLSTKGDLPAEIQSKMPGEQPNKAGDVFTLVDETATPVAGMSEYYQYIMHNLRYPADARKKGIEGKVYVEFIVGIDGDIEVTGVSGIGGGCELEAMRVVQSSPKWNPGKNNGVPVRQKMILPINFSLEGSTYKDISEAPGNSLDETVVVGRR